MFVGSVISGSYNWLGYGGSDGLLQVQKVMNYSAFAGYWFIGASTGDERASLFASYGLDSDVYSPPVGSWAKRFGNWFWEFFE